MNTTASNSALHCNSLTLARGQFDVARTEAGRLRPDQRAKAAFGIGRADRHPEFAERFASRAVRLGRAISPASGTDCSPVGVADISHFSFSIESRVVTHSLTLAEGEI